MLCENATRVLTRRHVRKVRGARRGAHRVPVEDFAQALSELCVDVGVGGALCHGARLENKLREERRQLRACVHTTWTQNTVWGPAVSEGSPLPERFSQ